MNNKKYHLVRVALLLLMLMPSIAQAQLGFDFLSVEALIDDHKRVRSALLARSGIEQANELLHQYSKDSNVEYKDINAELDKYQKAFDVIDVIYNGGSTALNVYNTYDDVKDRVVKLKKLIEDFAEKCTLKGNILSSDTLIINTCKRTIDTAGDDGKELVKSLAELAAYATGAEHATTEDLMRIMGAINESLDHIRESVDHAYYVIWKYVTIRTHYWKKEIYRAKDLNDMANDAFSRWRNASRNVLIKVGDIDY